MRVAKNMHSDPIKVQMASFLLSNPVEVTCSRPCGTSWATAVTCTPSTKNVNSERSTGKCAGENPGHCLPFTGHAVSPGRLEGPAVHPEEQESHRCDNP